MFKMKITTKELEPTLWKDLENLFGEKGACGGCWCQAWKLEKGEKWDDVKGKVAKARLKKEVKTKSVYGVIAFEGDKPIGWCNFGPRKSYPRLNRARTLKCDDIPLVWSVPCFFVDKDFREKGVAVAMLKNALKIMKKRGVKIAEGYPSKPGKDGRYIAAFSWTGTNSLFANQGFEVAGNQNGGKQRVRRTLNK